VLGTTEKLQTLMENWRFLKLKTLDLEPSSNDDLYTKLIGEIQALKTHVGDSSTLILDPEFDTYYLMDALLIRLADSQVRIARARLLGRDIAARKAVTAKEQAELISLAGLIKSDNDALRHGMKVAFDSTASNRLKRMLETPLQQSLVATDEFLALL